MKKHFSKILICVLITFMAISVVNAMDSNSTDDFMSFENNDEIIVEDYNEVLSVENNDEEIIFDNDSSNEILSAENSDEDIIAVNDNDSEELSVESNYEISFSDDNGNESLSVKNEENEVLLISDNSNDNLISKSNGNEILSITPGFYDDDTYYYNYEDDGSVSMTKSKIFLIATMKIHKKYWKMLIKEKKRTKKFKKMYKKKLKALKKAMKKKIKKLAKKGWYGSRQDSYDDILRKGKYYVFYYYGDFYKTYY